MSKRLRVLCCLTTVLFALGSVGAQELPRKVDETFLLLMAARNAAKAGRYETSLARYRRLLEKNPELTEARQELGWVLLSMNKLEEAQKEFEIVLKEKPRDALALRGFLEVLKKSGQKEEAVTTLERLVALVPEDRDLRFQLALELHNQGKYAEAEKHIRILLGEKDKGR